MSDKAKRPGATGRIIEGCGCTDTCLDCKCSAPSPPRQQIFDAEAYKRRIESAARRWQQKRRGAQSRPQASCFGVFDE